LGGGKKKKTPLGGGKRGTFLEKGGGANCRPFPSGLSGKNGGGRFQGGFGCRGGGARDLPRALLSKLFSDLKGGPKGKKGMTGGENYPQKKKKKPGGNTFAMLRKCSTRLKRKSIGGNEENKKKGMV